MSQLPPQIHSSWHKHLQPLFDDPKMQMIKDNIVQTDYYPDVDKVFRVFEMPLQDIKVVILGQDPYPNGEAIGLAFAVSENTSMPTSLRIIFNEVDRSSPQTLMGGRTLQHWVDQGVFLLNSALTVEPQNSGIHINIWKWFTKEVVRVISEEVKPIWLLWGGKAQAFISYINEGVPLVNVKTVDKDRLWFVNRNIKDNYILLAPHPAAESYNGGTGVKFTGCNHFNLCNEILKLKGLKEINW